MFRRPRVSSTLPHTSIGNTTNIQGYNKLVQETYITTRRNTYTERTRSGRRMCKHGTSQNKFPFDNSESNYRYFRNASDAAMRFSSNASEGCTFTQRHDTRADERATIVIKDILMWRLGSAQSKSRRVELCRSRWGSLPVGDAMRDR